MKKLLKKILLCLLLVPTIFFMFACNVEPPVNPGDGNTGNGTSQEGGSQNGGSQGGSSQGGGSQGGGSQGGDQGGDQGGSVDPVVAAKNSAYAIINNIAKNDIYAGFESLELYAAYKYAEGSYFDLSQINLTEEEWDACVEQSSNWELNPKMPEGDFYVNLPYPSYYGIKTNGEGYLYQKDKNITDLDAKFVGAVVSYQDKLIYDDNQSFAYVDNNYAPNTFKYDFSNNEYKILDVFAKIGTTSTYNELSTALVSIVDGLNTYYNNEYLNFDEVDIQVKTDINILENSEYELVINAVYDTKISNEPGIAGAGEKVLVYLDYVIKFNNNSILSINIEDGYLSDGNSWTSTNLRDWVNVNGTGKTKQEAFPSGCKITLKHNYLKKYEFSFNAFDETKMPDNADEYASSTIQNKSYDFYIIYQDAEGTQTSSGLVKISFGETIVSHITSQEGTYDLYWWNMDDSKELIPLDTVITSYAPPSNSIIVKAKTTD